MIKISNYTSGGITIINILIKCQQSKRMDFITKDQLKPNLYTFVLLWKIGMANFQARFSRKWKL